MKEEDIKNLAEQTIQRYSGRYQQFKYDIKTLGWGSVEQQEYRFLEVLKRLDLKGKSVLDIGCGFGDLFNYMNKINVEFDAYTGWDITPDFIENSIVKNENVTLEVKDISAGAPEAPVADVGIMLGLLNWKWDSAENNYAYSKRLIANALASVNDVLVIDFLSTNYTDTYPVEDFVFYHDPMIMFKAALEMSENVDLIHSYAPVPQKEFLLFIYK